MLTVTAADTGTTRVVVTATAEGKSVQDGFQVEVNYTNPYTMDEIGDLELTVGDVEGVPVGDNFRDPDGQDLVAHAASMDEDVATVAVDGSMVTVTAEGVGTATISVYAEDEDGLRSDSLSFEVTVMAAPAMPEETEETEETEDIEPVSDTIIIPGDQEKATIDLAHYLPDDADANHYTLTPTSTSVFKAEQKGSTSMWDIIAIARGTISVEIIHKTDRMVARTLTVDVKNKGPRIKPDMNEPYARPLGALLMDHPTINTMNKGQEIGAKTSLNLYRLMLDPAMYFEDRDDDVLGYKFSTSRADVVIQQGEMCTTTPCVVWIDLIRAAGFDLAVVAVDPSGDESGVLPFPIEEVSPPDQTYTVRQRPSNDEFIGITVGRREGVNHTLTFSAVPTAADTPAEGFGFVDALITKVDGFAPDESPGVTYAPVPPALESIIEGTDRANVLYGVLKPLNMDAAGALLPETTAVYTVKASSNLVPSALTLTNGIPGLTFQIIGLRKGTIEIGYHIWYDEDGVPDGDDVDDTKPAMWHSDSRTLSVTVVPVK